jgi:hypothetical protein
MCLSKVRFWYDGQQQHHKKEFCSLLRIRLFALRSDLIAKFTFGRGSKKGKKETKKAKRALVFPDLFLPFFALFASSSKRAIGSLPVDLLREGLSDY